MEFTPASSTSPPWQLPRSSAKQEVQIWKTERKVLPCKAGLATRPELGDTQEENGTLLPGTYTCIYVCIKYYMWMERKSEQQEHTQNNTHSVHCCLSSGFWLTGPYSLQLTGAPQHHMRHANEEITEQVFFSRVKKKKSKKGHNNGFMSTTYSVLHVFYKVDTQFLSPPSLSLLFPFFPLPPLFCLSLCCI